METRLKPSSVPNSLLPLGLACLDQLVFVPAQLLYLILFVLFRFYPLKDLRQAFMLFDKDKSGFIEAREIREVTTTLGMPLSMEELEDFMKMADQGPML